VVGAADLKAVTPVNELVKFADDTYNVIPAANDSSRQTELNHVAEWARKNNLKTNPVKFTEIVFVHNRKKKGSPATTTTWQSDYHKNTWNDLYEKSFCR